jgi:hypothetical protein
VVSLIFRPIAGATGSAAIALSPNVGSPTHKVIVKGTGFGKGEAVVVEFGSTTVASDPSSSTGSFSASFRVPRSARPGHHRVTATGKASGRSADASFLVRTNWPKYHFGRRNRGFNPVENVIGPGNVSRITRVWAGVTGGGVFSAPAVVGDVAYVGSQDDHALYAFSANGTAGCSGIPRTCAPLWTGPVTADVLNSSPAVANGAVYIAFGHRLYAFSRRGTSGCSGTPRTCTPLWTAGVGADLYSPAAVHGVVYVEGGDGKLYAFSAKGTINCSGVPKKCKPLWTGVSGPGFSRFVSPAVANGLVYVAKGHNLYAFSAKGTTGCSGTPKICKPLLTGATGNTIWASSPAVAHNRVYVGSTDHKLYAFSAKGTTGCSGTPKRCKPLWTGTPGGEVSTTPAVANGVVYVGSGGKLSAFSAKGTTGCSGTPRKCKPLWTGATGGIFGSEDSSPVVANRVVYIVGDKLYAFSAKGTINCSGVPKRCDPLSTWPVSTFVLSTPAVANGVVYIGSGPYLLAFHK